MTISLTGFMGCGKSSTGRALAERLGARFVDLDAEIVARDGRPIPEIFREGGEVAFRAVELETLRAVLDEAASAQGDVVLALGGGTLTVPAAREIILAETECVFLRTRLETIRERLGAADASRPLFADAEALFAARAPIYAQAPHVVDTDGLTPDAVADAILIQLTPGVC
ncbi:MAG: shikimate kinase [Bacteroidales bacterium]|nr:shikimate kinase [Bacteroidales bacterium]MBR6875221.1 shikimate kinase [Bacteroidales bacterium]